MIYTANITTNAKTWKTNLKQTRINVTKGLVYQFELYFPAGSAGLMGIAVFDGLFQVWPSSVGEFFIGEDHLISFPDMYLKEAAPFEFQIYTYNEDTEHNHFASVRIGLVSKEVFLARFLPTKTDAYMIKLIAGLMGDQEARARVQREQLEQTVFEWMLVEQKKEIRLQKQADRRQRTREKDGIGFTRL
ncbi:hypothetical protein ES702_05088 [subsurface metagenome]